MDEIGTEDLQELLRSTRERVGVSPASSLTSSKADPEQCECGRGPIVKLVLPLTKDVIRRPCDACVAESEAKRAEEERTREQREAAERVRKRTDRIEVNLGRLGVTRKYLGVSFGSFRPDHDRRALDAARELVDAFVRGDRSSLYLYSERPGQSIAPGAGKTHLAVSILRELALNPDVPLEDLGFAFVPKVLLEMQATFKHPEKSELEIVEKYTRPELLVWDDLGTEKLGDYSGRMLYTILYEREGKANVFTSNYSLDDIESRDPSGYAARITSRIAGESRIVRMTGPDRRLAA